ncbi:MAG: MauE/DoxX family redox-associated membrane protein [Bacteroidota bacterium]
MKFIVPGLRYLLGAFLIYAGVNHFTTPDMYAPFIPDFLPEAVVNYGTGVLEILLGLGLFIPATREKAALGIFLLMIAFLPLHVIDVFSESPAIGSREAAYIRLPFQFLFLLWSWWVWKKTKPAPSRD